MPGQARGSAASPSPPPGFRGTLSAIAPVSDDVWHALQAYAGHLAHWQQTLNLVAPATMPALWERHILDCWQLLPLVPRKAQGPVIDLGSGAGLPGMILAIAGIPDVHLIESNHRKAGFLRFVAQQTGVPVRVHAQRIEAVDPADVGPARAVTARALAALPALLSWALPFCGADTRLTFQKGRSWRQEVADAKAAFRFEMAVRESVTEREAVILEMHSIERR